MEGRVSSGIAIGPAMPFRRPVVTFVLLPFVCIVAIALALMFVMFLLGDEPLVTNAALRNVFFAVRATLLWVAPVAVSALFAWLGYRHRTPLRWPLMAIAIVCALVALINVGLVIDLSGPDPQGQLTMGLGSGPDVLPGQAMRAMLTALVVVIPLVLATWKRGRDRG
jgi:hypothetical protein